MNIPRTPVIGEEGKGKRRMNYMTFEDGLVRREMDLRGLSIRTVALKGNVSPQSVRRAIDSLPLRGETAVVIWNAVVSFPKAAEGFAEAVQMAAAG